MQVANDVYLNVIPFVVISSSSAGNAEYISKLTLLLSKQYKRKLRTLVLNSPMNSVELNIIFNSKGSINHQMLIEVSRSSSMMMVYMPSKPTTVMYESLVKTIGDILKISKGENNVSD